MKRKRRLKVGVFFGGPSSEREISLESGRNIYNHLNREKYEVIPIFMDRENKFWQIKEELVWMNTTADIIRALRWGGRRIFYDDLPSFLDFAFLGLHGKFVEDGCLQGLLEIINLPYNGSGVLGSALGMDKFFQRKLLQERGVSVPRHRAVCLGEWQERKEKIKEEMTCGFGFPFIVKPSREGCSVGVRLVKRKEEIEEAFAKAFLWDDLILIEEFLEGVEVTVVVLGNRKPFALMPTETPHRGDFLTVEEKFLPGEGEMITPPRLPQKAILAIQKTAVRAYQALELKVYARIDGIWVRDKLVVLEPNTLPGLTPSTCVFHQAAEAGLNPEQFLDRIIELSLEAHREKIGPL